MKKTLLYITLSSLVLTSCSSFHSPESLWSRSIAAEKVQTPISLDELMSFKQGRVYNSAENYIDELSRELNFNYGELKGIPIKFNFITDPTMRYEQPFRIVPSLDGNAYTINFYHSPSAYGDKGAVVELEKFINLAMNDLTSPYSIFELYSNAKEGDFESLQTLAKLRAAAVTDKVHSTVSMHPLDFKEETKVYWRNILKQFENEGVKNTQNNLARGEKRKAKMSALDNLPESKQFYALVAQNDRKGAADLLRNYLPWEEMQPLEIKYWAAQLDIMENPLPIEQRIMLTSNFGSKISMAETIGIPEVQSNMIPLDENGISLPYVQALKEQKLIFTTPYLNFTPGSANQKLSSINNLNSSALAGRFYKKQGAFEEQSTLKYSAGTRITTFLENSKSIDKSPFLLFNFISPATLNKNTTAAATFFIDPRAIYINSITPSSGAAKMAGPIVIFPDEVAAAYYYKVHKDPADTSKTIVEDFFNKTATLKLDKKFGENEGASILEKIKNNTAKFKDSIKVDATAAKVVPILDNKLGKILSKNLPETEKIDYVVPDNNHGCYQLVAMFIN